MNPTAFLISNRAFAWMSGRNGISLRRPGTSSSVALTSMYLTVHGFWASDVAQPPGFAAVQPSVVAVGQ